MRPKTQEEKEMQGTLEPSREKEVQTVEFSQVEKFISPKEWPDEAKFIFQDLCGIVRNGGHLTKAVYLGLRSLAEHEYHRRLAEVALIDDPTDSKWLKVMDIRGKAVERGLAKFGMYPADLYRVPQIKKEEKTMSLLR